MPATIGMSAASATSRSIESSNRPITREAMKDRKSTRLNSSHSQISYAVFCLKKKKTKTRRPFLTSNTPQPNVPYHTPLYSFYSYLQSQASIKSYITSEHTHNHVRCSTCKCYA